MNMKHDVLARKVVVTGDIPERNSGNRSLEDGDGMKPPSLEAWVRQVAATKVDDDASSDLV